MPTKEKFYQYVRNATIGKKCYVNHGSRKMFLAVPVRFFIVHVLIVSKFVERYPASSGFSRPDATLRRVASGLEKPLLAG